MAAGRRHEITGKKGYCPKCAKDYLPGAIARMGIRFSDMVSRRGQSTNGSSSACAYRIITQVTEHLLWCGLCVGSVINFLKYLAGYYSAHRGGHAPGDSESDFVHVDETRSTSRGGPLRSGFTDGQHVILSP